MKKKVVMSRNVHFYYIELTFFDITTFFFKSYERQTILHLNALVGGSKILEEQLSSSFRGCHTTSPLKSVFFTRKVAWQPLIELQSWAWDILCPTSRANYEVSLDYVAQVVLTQIYYKAKNGNWCLINYDTECKQQCHIEPYY